MHLAPGDVADTISQSMGGADAEILAEIRADYGLDKPFIVQLGTYIGKILRFDLGYSFFYNQPVTDLIFQNYGDFVTRDHSAIIGIVRRSNSRRIFGAAPKWYFQPFRHFSRTVWIFCTGVLDGYLVIDRVFLKPSLVSCCWHA